MNLCFQNEIELFMNLKTYEPKKNITQILYFLITKNTDKIIQQTQATAQKTWEYKLTKSIQHLSFDIPLQLEKVN